MAQLIARSVWDREVEGLSPFTPTIRPLLEPSTEGSNPQRSARISSTSRPSLGGIFSFWASGSIGVEATSTARRSGAGSDQGVAVFLSGNLTQEFEKELCSNHRYFFVVIQLSSHNFFKVVVPCRNF